MIGQNFTMKRQPYIKSSNLKERTGSFLSMPSFENRRKMTMGKSYNLRDLLRSGGSPSLMARWPMSSND